MLRFSVGYQPREDRDWVNCILENRDRISEVFFAPYDIPNGRTGEWVIRNDLSYERMVEVQDRDLCAIAREGIPLNVLFNAGCYGKSARSKELLGMVINRVKHYRDEFGLQSVTTTSPFIAEAVKDLVDGVMTRASINMDISSAQGMDYSAPYFDGYYLKRELNRDLARIRSVRAWCDKNGKQLFMLANSGCLNDCSIRIFHNNLVAHGGELEDVDKRYPLRGCRDYLMREGKLPSLIKDTNWVRPEDIHLYDGLFDSIKLATRVNRDPERILKAYVAEKYDGSILDLLEPDHSYPLRGGRIENKLFPADFGERVGNCKKVCEDCDYCKIVFARTYVPAL